MNFDSDVLDITKYLEMTQEDLAKQITLDVEATQSKSIVLPLPNILRMRKDQYDILQDDPDLQQMYQSEDRMYMTPINVMEVRIT